MKKIIISALAAFGVAFGQAPEHAPAASSISGAVRGGSGGAPLAGAVVSVYINADWVDNALVTRPGTKQIKSTTDELGSYKLADLPAGRYRVVAQPAAGSRVSGPSKAIWVTVSRGEQVVGRDLVLQNYGSIKGRVIDENDEPVAGVWVHLVSVEYFLGRSGYFPKEIAVTNEEGVYSVEQVEAGHSYILLGEKHEVNLNVAALAADDPKLRRPAYAPTFYPNARSADAAAPIVLRAGERRDGIVIHIARGPSYCVEGHVTAEGSPGSPIRLSLVPEVARGGIAPGSAFFPRQSSAEVPASGNIRVCDLSPGRYRLTALQFGTEAAARPALGITTLQIADEDLKHFSLHASTGRQLTGSLEWEDAPPVAGSDPIKVTVSLQPVYRARVQGEQTSAAAPVPGRFTLPAVANDAYRVQVSTNSAGIYVKDIAYGSSSVLTSPLDRDRAGSDELRILLRHDGATLAAHVVNRENAPVPDAFVYAAPAQANSEEAFSDLLLSGQTDQNGDYKAVNIRPDRYYVIALLSPVDKSVSQIRSLFLARAKAQTLEVGPSATAQVRLETVALQ